MSKPGLLLAAVLAAAFSSAQDQDFSKVQIKVTKVAGNVYMLEGEGGNIGASVGEDGIVVVDDQYAPLAEKIQATLRGITDKPIRCRVPHTFAFFANVWAVRASVYSRVRIISLETNGQSSHRWSLLVMSTHSV